MSDSRSFKPGSRPGTSPSPDPSKTGRVVHDERGNAVWDWVKDTARIAIDSTSRLLKKLEAPELSLEDTRRGLGIEPGRDAGGGYDPYGSSTSGRSATPRGLGTAAPDRANRSFAMTSGARRDFAGSGATRGNSPTKDPGGGYDPYGKGAARKPTR